MNEKELNKALLDAVKAGFKENRKREDVLVEQAMKELEKIPMIGFVNRYYSEIIEPRITSRKTKAKVGRPKKGGARKMNTSTLLSRSVFMPTGRLTRYDRNR
jgi:hypothetical protein